MNITLGVWDLFLYTIPGSLYLALLTYVAERLNWIDPMRLLQANTTLVVIAAAILSYLIGHVSASLGALLGLVYGRRKTMADAVHEFAKATPAARGRPFLLLSRSMLQAAIEIYDTSAAAEISRLRAVAFMLRNAAPVFVLGAIIEIVDAATGEHPAVAGCCIIIFPLVAIGCLYRSTVWRHWADVKTLELAYWIPGIDDNLLDSSSMNRAKRPDQSPSTRKVRKSATSTSQPPHRPTEQSHDPSGDSLREPLQ